MNNLKELKANFRKVVVKPKEDKEVIDAASFYNAEIISKIKMDIFTNS